MRCSRLFTYGIKLNLKRKADAEDQKKAKAKSKSASSKPKAKKGAASDGLAKGKKHSFFGDDVK